MPALQYGHRLIRPKSSRPAFSTSRRQSSSRVTSVGSSTRGLRPSGSQIFGDGAELVFRPGAHDDPGPSRSELVRQRVTDSGRCSGNDDCFVLEVHAFVSFDCVSGAAVIRSSLRFRVGAGRAGPFSSFRSRAAECSDAKSSVRSDRDSVCTCKRLCSGLFRGACASSRRAFPGNSYLYAAGRAAA